MISPNELILRTAMLCEEAEGSVLTRAGCLLGSIRSANLFKKFIPGFQSVDCLENSDKLLVAAALRMTVVCRYLHLVVGFFHYIIAIVHKR